jgi:hypothetical protein
MNPYAVEHQCSETTEDLVMELRIEIERLQRREHDMVGLGFVYGGVSGVMATALYQTWSPLLRWWMGQ